MTATTLLLLVLVAPAADPAPAAKDLFDGKSLAGWVVEGPREFKSGGKTLPVWVARDGLLSCVVDRGSFGFLRYDRPFGDFHLTLEYRFAAPAGATGKRGNSGVGIRTVAYDPKRSTQTRPSLAGYEVQLLDDADRKASRHSTGSLYRYVAPAEQAALAAPAWNRLGVRCVGPRVEVTLNGKKVLDVDQSTLAEIRGKPLRGYISLQNHGSRVDFRHLRVREIQ